MHTLSHHFHNKHDFGPKSLTDMYPITFYNRILYIIYGILYTAYFISQQCWPSTTSVMRFLIEFDEKLFSKSQKHIIPWNFGHFQHLKKDGFRSRTLLGRLNEWAERVRIGNRFMVFISRENDSFPRYPVRKLAWKWIEIWLAKVLIGLWIEIQFSCFCNRAICLRIFQNESFFKFHQRPSIGLFDFINITCF